jgi:hypothetical protein
MRAQLVKCSDTPWTGSCGEDDLTAGWIVLQDNGRVHVNVQGALADPFNLYDVYWLPVGGVVTDAIFVGNFATRCHGNRVATLREITTPQEGISGTVSNMFTKVGPTSAGNFLVYSRGPWAFDHNGDCTIDEYNTVPLGTDPTQPLANPTANVYSDVVQFISGYSK